MYAKRRLLLTATLAVVAFGALVGSSAAASFGIEPSGIRTISRGLLTFTGVATDVRCSITLGGTLHRGLIAKATGALIGFITEANDACSRGTAVALEETIPWHLRFISITGTLPNAVTSAKLELFRPSYRIGLCLTEESPRFTAALTNTNEANRSRYTARELVSDNTPLMTCFETTAMLLGTFNITPVLTITRN